MWNINSNTFLYEAASSHIILIEMGEKEKTNSFIWSFVRTGGKNKKRKSSELSLCF
jgi:hypothetical protein